MSAKSVNPNFDDDSVGGGKRRYESERQRARQAHILSTTRDMLAELGYEKTTIRGLAERAGVAPGTLYNLYHSKDELILAAVEDLLAELSIEAAASSAPGLDRILKFVETSAVATRDNAEYAVAMTKALVSRSEDERLTAVLYKRGLPMLREHLRIAQQNRTLRPGVDIERLALHIQAQRWGITIAWLMGLVPLDEIVRETERSIVVSLLAFVEEDQRSQLERRVGLALKKNEEGERSC